MIYKNLFFPLFLVLMLSSKQFQVMASEQTNIEEVSINQNDQRSKFERSKTFLRNHKNVISAIIVAIPLTLIVGMVVNEIVNPLPSLGFKDIDGTESEKTIKQLGYGILGIGNLNGNLKDDITNSSMDGSVRNKHKVEHVSYKSFNLNSIECVAILKIESLNSNASDKARIALITSRREFDKEVKKLPKDMRANIKVEPLE